LLKMAHPNMGFRQVTAEGRLGDKAASEVTAFHRRIPRFSSQDAEASKRKTERKNGLGPTQKKCMPLDWAKRSTDKREGRLQHQRTTSERTHLGLTTEYQAAKCKKGKQATSPKTLGNWGKGPILHEKNGGKNRR